MQGYLGKRTQTPMAQGRSTKVTSRIERTRTSGLSIKKSLSVTASPMSSKAILAPGCSLHPTPCTLHPAPYTLHPARYTLHPTPCTLHPAPCTLLPTPNALHTWPADAACCSRRRRVERA